MLLYMHRYKQTGYQALYIHISNIKNVFNKYPLRVGICTRFNTYILNRIFCTFNVLIKTHIWVIDRSVSTKIIIILIQNQNKMSVKNIKAYGTEAADAALGQLNINRRAVNTMDVEIDILFCGVCHSDLHFARNDWGMTQYPVVPGHEIVGRVIQVGGGVSKYKVGDLVAVGCLVDSCRTCKNCKNDLEQYCPEWVGTYGGYDKHLETNTHGGYSESIVVDEAFVLRVPENLDQAGIAPVLCAGITTWSPLRHWKVGKDSKVAVVGLARLGTYGHKISRCIRSPCNFIFQINK